MQKVVQEKTDILFIDKKGIADFSHKIKLSKKIRYEKETGFLYCYDAIVGNVGVQLYAGHELGKVEKNKIFKVHRIKEELFNDESIDSLKGKPLTDLHPSVMVDSSNYKDFTKGSVYGEPRASEDGINLIVDIVIYDEDLVNKIAPLNFDGTRTLSDNFKDLSLGYKAELVELEGTDDFYQKNIIYNHLAVVKEGRAKNAQIVFDSKLKNKEEKKKMGLLDLFKGRKIKLLDEETFEIVDEDIEKDEAKEVKEEKEVKVSEKKDEELKTKEKEDTKKEVEDEKEVKDENKEEKKEDMTKDQKYFDSKFEEAMKLPSGSYKDNLLKRLNDEYNTLFPSEETQGVFVDTVNYDNLNVKNEKVKPIDYHAIERKQVEYYDKLTNPESKHFDSIEEQEKFYQKELRKGRV